MRALRVIGLGAALLVLAPLCVQARGGHGGGGHVGGMMGHPGGGGGGWHSTGHPIFFHTVPHVFIGGGFGLPFFWPPTYYGWGPASAYPYPYPYPYGYPYPYPGTYPPDYPPSDSGGQSAPPDAGSPPPEGSGAQADSQDPGTYGLIQLRGVPDGASVFLDGRFWLVAHGLDGRWLALPDGQHTITVRMTGYQEVTTSLEVVPGTSRVFQIQPMRGAEDRQGAGEPLS
jgi:hypothetical protein